jgi:hypothetical protein
MTKTESDKREDAVLKRMLKTPPKHQAGFKHPRTAKPKPSPGDKRGRTKKAASTSASKAADVS